MSGDRPQGRRAAPPPARAARERAQAADRRTGSRAAKTSSATRHPPKAAEGTSKPAASKTAAPTAGAQAAGGASQRSAPAMDPRIKERRVKVTREAGRRRLRGAAAAAGVLVACVGAWGLTRSPVLDIDQIAISGATRTLAADIRAAGHIERGRPVLDVDLDEAERKIEALPWVLRAEVRRRLPGTVAVDIVERVPAALVAGHAFGVAVVDRSGRILAIEPTIRFGLAVVVDAPVPDKPGTTVPATTLAGVRAAAALPARLRPMVASVRITGDGPELALHGGGVVILGGDDDVEAKMRSALTVLLRVPARHVARLDVTVPTAPVLTRKSTAPPARAPVTTTSPTANTRTTATTKPGTTSSTTSTTTRPSSTTSTSTEA